MSAELSELCLQDLGTILTFLRICHPLDNEDMFKRLILRPLKNGDNSGAELLRVSLCSDRSRVETNGPCYRLS